MADEMETLPRTRASPPLFADRVGKMILYLSKARQYKRRLHWRAKLRYVAIVHAAIPFVYTFSSTMPNVAFWACVYAAAAGLVVTILLNQQKRASEEVELFSILCSAAVKTTVFILVSIPVIFLVAGLPGARSALGLPRVPGNWTLPVAVDQLLVGSGMETDVCGEILDTQGQCCCSKAY